MCSHLSVIYPREFLCCTRCDPDQGHQPYMSGLDTQQQTKPWQMNRLQWESSHVADNVCV